MPNNANKKLKEFAKAIITLDYFNHPLYEFFLEDWKFKIDINNKRIVGIVLYDIGTDTTIYHEFSEDNSYLFYQYFLYIGILD